MSFFYRTCQQIQLFMTERLFFLLYVVLFLLKQNNCMSSFFHIFSFSSRIFASFKTFVFILKMTKENDVNWCLYYCHYVHIQIFKTYIVWQMNYFHYNISLFNTFQNKMHHFAPSFHVKIELTFVKYLNSVFEIVIVFIEIHYHFDLKSNHSKANCYSSHYQH